MLFITDAEKWCLLALGEAVAPYIHIAVVAGLNVLVVVGGADTLSNFCTYSYAESRGFATTAKSSPNLIVPISDFGVSKFKLKRMSRSKRGGFTKREENVEQGDIS